MELHVASMINCSQSVRAIEWASGSGVLVSTAVGLSSYTLADYHSPRQLWTLVGSEPEEGQPECTAEAGTARSEWTATIPSLVFFPSPLARGSAAAFVSGSHLTAGWRAQLTDPAGASACLGAPALSVAGRGANGGGLRAFAHAYLHGQNGTIFVLRQRDGAVAWSWDASAGLVEGEPAGTLEELAGPAEVGGSEILVIADRGTSDIGTSDSGTTDAEQLVASVVRRVAAGANCTARGLVRALAAGAETRKLLWEVLLGPVASAPGPSALDETGSAPAGEACECNQTLTPPRLAQGSYWAGSSAPPPRARGGGGNGRMGFRAGGERLGLFATVDGCRVLSGRGGGEGSGGVKHGQAQLSNAPPAHPAAHHAAAAAYDAEPIAQSPGRLVAFEPTAGHVRWEQPLPAGGSCSRAVLDFGSSLFLVCTTGFDSRAPMLVSFDSEGGQLRTSLALAAPTEWSECEPPIQCELTVTAAQPTLSADGVVHVLAAVTPRLLGAQAKSVCALLRYSTHASIGDDDATSAAGGLEAPRPLRAIKLTGPCDREWFERHRGSRPLVLLREDGAIALAAGKTIWLLGHRDRCAGVACDHGICRNGTCFCEANYLSADCSQLYSPYRAEWPVWIGLGATLSLLAMVFVCLVGVYRSFLWIKFRLQMMQVRQHMESQGYSISHEGSNISASDVTSVGNLANLAQPQRRGPLMQGSGMRGGWLNVNGPAPDAGSNAGSVASLLEEAS
jgi:hypothetical protein